MSEVTQVHRTELESLWIPAPAQDHVFHPYPDECYWLARQAYTHSNYEEQHNTPLHRTQLHFFECFKEVQDEFHANRYSRAGIVSYRAGLSLLSSRADEIADTRGAI